MKKKSFQYIIMLLFTSVGLFSSCGLSSRHSGAHTFKYNLDTFSVFPPDIVGCSAYYAADSTLFFKQGYIVTGNCGQIAYAKLNGKLTKFTHTSSQKISDFHVIEHLKSDELEMTLDITDGEVMGSEVWRQTGTLTLKDEEGNTITKKLFGESGY